LNKFIAQKTFDAIESETSIPNLGIAERHLAPLVGCIGKARRVRKRHSKIALEVVAEYSPGVSPFLKD
jgi:hypothetical protein